MGKIVYRMDQVIEATNVKALDNSLPDPYIAFSYLNKVYSTQKVKKTSNPVWNEGFVLNVFHKNQEFTFYIVNHELVGDHHILGEFTFRVNSDVPTGNTQILCYRFGSPMRSGEVHIKYQFYGYGNLVTALKGSKTVFLKSLTHTTFSPEVSNAIMHYAIKTEHHQDLSTYIIAYEVHNTSKPTQLFRFDSRASKLLVSLLKTVGMNWFNRVFAERINEVCSNGACEVDPNKLGPNEDIEKNSQRFVELCQKFLNSILKEFVSSNPLPPDILRISYEIHAVVSQKFKDYTYQAIGGIIFLRWICPLITIPPPSIISPDRLTVSGRRTLLLISKVIQACVNQVQFEVKEAYMVRFNSLLVEFSPKIRDFLFFLANPRIYIAPPRPRQNYRENLVMLDLLVSHAHQNWESVSTYINENQLNESTEQIKTSDLIKSLDDLVTCQDNHPQQK
eukprot:TRINITY_DN7211_c0_g1_i4.p1 TRINITY_DN7211_c0_g1~~TRINITY_DN7211_c0_g1_i4.p1  ORF type:complete len:448 (-),score=71.19 TRINITY_DN7211_c0_g1_i4:704-2047(-)